MATTEELLGQIVTAVSALTDATNILKVNLTNQVSTATIAAGTATSQAAAVTLIKNQIDGLVASLTATLNGIAATAQTAITNTSSTAITTVDNKAAATVVALDGAISDGTTTLNGVATAATATIATATANATAIISSLAAEGTGEVEAAVTSGTTAINGIISTATANINVLVTAADGHADRAEAAADAAEAAVSGFVPASYNVTTLPDPTEAELHSIIAVTDGDAGALCLAVNDGTDWLRVVLGTAVAIA